MTSEMNYRGGFSYSGLLALARELRQRQTPAECILWELVRNRRLFGLKFRRQHQIGLYIADFYCAEQRFVVELDGEIHDDERQAAFDNKRDQYLRSLGLTVLRVSNDLLLNAPERVLQDMVEVLGIFLPPEH